MGGKKQGSARTPHEAPDSLKSAQRLRAIGLISLGPIKGPVNKWKSTYFDNTPIQNENGVDDNDEASFNFKNTEVSFTLGTQDQLPLQGFEMSEREVSVSTEVKYTTPITRTVTDPDVTRLRVTLGVNALYEQNDQGDTNGTSVWFRILINGLPRATYEINGKSSSRFYRSYIIDNLPERPFTITVERTTTDSKSQRLQNATNWVSYTEIIDTKLSYPNMALVGIKTDSRYNPNFPNVNFLLYGRLVKVPSTYDPETRTYSTALWKGDWKQAWTNNLAWVFYDLVTDPLAGLGKRVGDYGLDKFQLYQIAKYCDELVDDGYGGKEPRMTANLWLTDQRSAYDVLSDMASVFRSIAVWNGTQFTAIQDRTTDPVCTYSQANVIDGKFSRQYAAMKSIYTAVEVEYADERNMYQKAVEYVADDSMIARYGYNVKKMTAYATTSRGQAHRWGKWVLATSLLEQCTITFSVGRQGLMHLPGDIIEVADNNYAGKVLGGRVVAISGKKVTLDQPVDITGESYLSWLNDDMKLTKVKIAQVDAKNKAIVTLASEPVGLEPMDDWVLKTPAVSTQLYRAIGITENDDGSYTITALQHEPQKEAIVDGSASFMPVATTAHTGGLSAIQNAEVMATDGGILLTFTQPSFMGKGLKYQVKLYRDKKLYDIYDDLPEPQLAFNDLPDGEYVAEIRAKNAAGQLSEPKTVTFTVSFTITELVTVPKIFAIDLNWQNPLFANTKSSIELWVSADNNFNNARKLVTLAYPTNSYTYSGLGLTDRFWFWARMTDGYNSGKFTAAVEGVPSSDATQLTSYLDGQITKSHLGQSLIESLQSDINDAVAGEAGVRKSAVANAVSQIIAETQARVKALQDEAKARAAAITAEANNRTKAIQAESANLTKKIQDEAKARGAAVTQLQQTDAQQAQLIIAATAKADQLLVGLQEEKTARAEADKAEAQARNALTSRVASAESGIAEMRQSIATASSSIAEAKQNLNAKIDGLSVGGRNYLKGSRVDEGFWFYTKSGASTGSSRIDNKQLVWLPDTDQANQWKQWQQTGYDVRGIKSNLALNDINVSDNVVISFFAKNESKTNQELQVILTQDVTSGNRADLSNHIITLPAQSDKTRYVINLKILKQKPALYKGNRLILSVRTPIPDGAVYVDMLKLEKGTIATDWTPAPEDAESALNSVFADLTSYKQTQATKEQATAQQISGLNTRLANTESGISRVEKAVSDNQASTATQLNQLSVNLTKAQTDLNAKITQEQTARANADKVNTDRITSVTSRVASAESSISNIQSTKASKTEVATLAQQSLQAVWQADAQAKVDAISVGGRNLLVGAEPQSAHWFFTKHNNSKATSDAAQGNLRIEASADGNQAYWKQWQQFGYDYRSYKANPAINDCEVNAIYTASFQAQNSSPNDIIVNVNIRYDVISGSAINGFNQSVVIPANSGWATYNVSGVMGNTIPENYKGNRFLFVVNSAIPSGELLIRKIKFEKGTIATDWTPAPEDAESALNAVSSKVDSVQQALTTANQALGSRIDTVTASVNDTKSQVSQVSRAVSDVSGKLSATSTLKTQVIAGGRKAIAGIALGAQSDGKTAESSVIVMADKFGVVKNANDGNVVSMLSVVNNKVAINGDLIADGAILGKHIKASQTLTSPNINGGTITGNTITGATIIGTEVSGGTVTGATVSGGIVNRSRIEGGVISGSTILGDIVKAIILTKKGNGFEGTVPASEVSSRTVVIPSLSFKANSGETSTVTIYIDGSKVAESTVTGIKKEIPIMATIAPAEIRGSVSVSVSGEVGGDLSGSVSGTVNGQASGQVSGRVSGYVNGSMVSGQASGTASGALSGQVSGQASGRASGRVSGTATGFATGTTPITNVRTSFMLEVPTSGSISGYKQIKGNSVVVKITANNANALSGQNSLVALVA